MSGQPQKKILFPAIRTFLREHPGMDFVRRIIGGEQRVPFHDTLGITFKNASAGEATLVSNYDPAVTGNGYGPAHGGYAVSLLDAAAGFAVVTTCPRGHFNVSAGIENMRYRVPITEDCGELTTTGHVLTPDEYGDLDDLMRSWVGANDNRRIARAKIQDSAGTVYADAYIKQVIRPLEP